MNKDAYNEYISCYYDLLIAIFNSDSIDDNKYENEVIVYDVTTSLPYAVFKNASTCAKFFNTNRDYILSSICRKNLREDKYLIERVK